MTVVGISRVKNEGDIIRGTLLHTATEVDLMIVVDNASTDSTADILAELVAQQLPLIVMHDPDPAYRQSAKMSALADRAAAECGYAGDTWIVPFDADELWYAPHRRLRDTLPRVADPIAVARLTNHLRTTQDIADPDPFRSMVWAQPEPQGLPKVAFRWEPGAIIHQGNHDVTLPSGGARVDALGVRHFPVRSVAQFISKARHGAAAYAAAPELPEDMGRHWREWGRLTDGQLEAGYYGTAGPDEAPNGWFYQHPERWLRRRPAPYRRWS